MNREYPERISYDPPRDEFYKARIRTLERENSQLREKLEKNAGYYGIGRDMFETRMTELQHDNDRLRDENAKLQQALIREAIRDVSV